MCGAKAGGPDASTIKPGETTIQGQVTREGPVVGYVRLLDSTGEFTAEVPASATGHFPASTRPRAPGRSAPSSPAVPPTARSSPSRAAWRRSRSRSDDGPARQDTEGRTQGLDTWGAALRHPAVPPGPTLDVCTHGGVTRISP
ncbi:hypothetical protein SALBM311S_01447 [Streptomyces alboniger]